MDVVWVCCGSAACAFRITGRICCIIDHFLDLSHALLRSRLNRGHTQRVRAARTRTRTLSLSLSLALHTHNHSRAVDSRLYLHAQGCVHCAHTHTHTQRAYDTHVYHTAPTATHMTFARL